MLSSNFKGLGAPPRYAIELLFIVYDRFNTFYCDLFVIQDGAESLDFRGGSVDECLKIKFNAVVCAIKILPFRWRHHAKITFRKFLKLKQNVSFFYLAKLIVT